VTVKAVFTKQAADVQAC